VDEPRAAEMADDLSRAQEALARASAGRASGGPRPREPGAGGGRAPGASSLRPPADDPAPLPDNTAFNKPVEDLHTTLVQLHELLGSVHLVAVEDQVYVNDIRIRAGDKASSIRELARSSTGTTRAGSPSTCPSTAPRSAP